MQTLEREVSAVEYIRCEWVPGTMDQVRLRLSDNVVQLTLEQLQQIAGIDAVHELYLKGMTALPFNPKLRRAFEKS